MARSIKQRKIDYEITFGTPEGKRVLNDMVKDNHVLEPVFDPENSHGTSFNDGQRNAVLKVLSVLHYEPQDFQTLAKEVEDDEA